jgi:protein O-GlcNAc transferase
VNQNAALSDGAEAARALRREGNRLLVAGDVLGALACLDRALSAHANDPLTLTARGNALQNLGRLTEAMTSYEEALRTRPEFPAALMNRANALRKLGRFEEALGDVELGLRLAPPVPEALIIHGTVLHDLERLEDARASFESALALRPEFVLAHCNLGKTFLELKQPAAALRSFESALALAGDDPEALFGRGSALLLLELNLETAVADFDRAAALGIERQETLVGKAAALARLDRHAEAAICLRELLLLSPQWPYAAGSLAHSLLQTGDWRELEHRRQAICAELLRGGKPTHPQSLLSLSDSPQLQLASARAFAAHQYPESRSLGPLSSNRAGAARRLRVAYVSADFREHPVPYLLVGALERHDRASFEVLGVSLREAGASAFGLRVQAACDRFIEVGERSDRQIATLLRELGVDIAIDLMGFTDGLRLGVFAQRAAPVQVSYLGYAGTMGAAYIDYLIADEVVIPEVERAWYAEQVVRMPHCYLPNDGRREIGPIPSRQAAGLPEEGLVLCAFTNAYKINPSMFAVWTRLLQALPDSVLWLRAMGAEARANLEREAEGQGVEKSRLVFAPRVASMVEHLARQALADLYLDTYPYNAHSTACDALWAGVPVITCAGRSMASRVAASALCAVGLSELITHSLEEYQAKALALASTPSELARLREQLRSARSRAPLFDTAAYTRSLESAYRHMHERAQMGLPPRDFAVATLSAVS